MCHRDRFSGSKVIDISICTLWAKDISPGSPNKIKGFTSQSQSYMGVAPGVTDGEVLDSRNRNVGFEPSPTT